MTRIFLIRHGEPTMKGRYIGKRSDPDLSDLGRAQAEACATSLAQERIDALYSSPLLRAQSTAKALSQKIGLPYVRKHGIEEMDFGLWEGLTYDEIRNMSQGDIDTWIESPAASTPPEGESLAQVQRRSLEALYEIVDMHPDSTVAVFTHGGCIRILFCSLFDIRLNSIWKLKVDYTGITELQFHPNSHAVLVRFNCLAPLAK